MDVDLLARFELFIYTELFNFWSMILLSGDPFKVG